MSTGLGFDVDYLVISLTGYYLDNATRAMDELSWIFKVEGAVTFDDGDMPIPSGLLSASVKLAMTYAFAPRGKAMKAALLALPDELKDGACSADDGDSCADGGVLLHSFSFSST